MIAAILLVIFVNGNVSHVMGTSDMNECITIGEAYLMEAPDRSYECIDNTAEKVEVKHES